MSQDFYREILSCLEREAGLRPRAVVPSAVRSTFFTAAEAAPSEPVAPSAVANPTAATSSGLSSADWKALENSCLNCSNCRLAHHRTHVVFGEGNRKADLMFIGEGPGRDEDLQGRPFVGEAGKLLDKMISAMTLKREDVYIANIVKCRPPGNRNPEPDEAQACSGYLARQIELVKPRAIVLLGSVPLQYLMNCRGITRLRGNWLDYRSIPVMPTFHPAYLLRTASAKREVWHDLQMVMQLLGLQK